MLAAPGPVRASVAVVQVRLPLGLVVVVAVALVTAGGDSMAAGTLGPVGPADWPLAVER